MREHRNRYRGELFLPDRHQFHRGRGALRLSQGSADNSNNNLVLFSVSEQIAIEFQNQSLQAGRKIYAKTATKLDATAESVVRVKRHEPQAKEGTGAVSSEVDVGRNVEVADTSLHGEHAVVIKLHVLPLVLRVKG